MLLATLALCTIFLPSGSGTDVEVQGQCKIEVAETTEQEVEMAYKQVTTPNTTVQDGIGWCLRHTQSVFASPVNFPTARKAWDGQQGRHTDTPPLGISVPIWFDHYGTYGSPAFWDNWGHVATRLSDGRVLTSPMYSSYGSEIYPDIQSMMNALGGGAKYLGWSEYMNGKQVVKYESAKPKPKPKPKPTITVEEEDDDMARYIGSYIGGVDGQSAVKNVCVIYEPTSGFYTTWSGVGNAYTNEMARVYSTGRFNRVTEKHWAKAILPQLLIQQRKGK